MRTFVGIGLRCGDMRPCGVIRILGGLCFVGRWRIWLCMIIISRLRGAWKHWVDGFVKGLFSFIQGEGERTNAQQYSRLVTSIKRPVELNGNGTVRTVIIDRSGSTVPFSTCHLHSFGTARSPSFNLCWPLRILQLILSQISVRSHQTPLPRITGTNTSYPLLSTIPSRMSTASTT